MPAPSILPRPVYRRKLFLNREDEVERFNDLLDRVSECNAGLRRVLVFQGERGIGKSWLLQHFHTLAQDRADVAPFLIRFRPEFDEPQPRIDESTPDDECIIHCALNTFQSTSEIPVPTYTKLFEQLIGGLISYLHHKELIETELHSGYSVDELSYVLVRMLESGLNSKGSILVLLVDSVYEADWKIIKWLEDYLLAPLVALDRVAIVLSGRGQPYPWINSLLRIQPVSDALQRWENPGGDRADSAVLREKHLGWLIQLIRTQVTESPFWKKPSGTLGSELELTPKQAERLAEIWRIGQGHQLLTVRLASSEQTDNQATLKILNEFVEMDLLRFLSPDRRTKLREYLEALCVLVYFREAETEQMVQRYFEITKRPTEGIRGRDILADLQRAYLVRWDREKNQYFVDDTIRIALSGWLCMAQLELWRKLHAEAQRMYEGWAKEYPQHQEYYRQRTLVHRYALNDHKGIVDSIDLLTN